MDNGNYIILMSDYLELFEHFFVKTTVILIRGSYYPRWLKTFKFI